MARDFEETSIPHQLTVQPFKGRNVTGLVVVAKAEGFYSGCRSQEPLHEKVPPALAAPPQADTLAARQGLPGKGVRQI